MERINKETGELSASGELASVSEELKGDGSVEGKEKEGVQRGSRLLQALREQLQDLGRRGPASSDRIHDERDPATHREERLLKVLPLYIQVCESDSRAEGVDLKGLAGLTADMVVSSIHSRLAARPAEEARYQVVDFFQRFDGQSDSEGTENPGWLLLKSLSLLTADNTTEDAVSWIRTGLPAALVKCLYLLVCLPAQQDNTAREDSFQQLLTQVLLQLCTQRASVEKMVETQELQCLIISLTSLWDQTSAPWRHQASRVLGAISAAQTRNTVPNLLDKNCVRICIQNLLRIGPDVPGPVLAEVALAVFGFVRDTYPINPALFAAFDANDGYAALESVLRRCEAGVPADQFQPVEDLLRFIASLTLLGKAELKVALCISNPQPPGFKFDPPLIKGGSKAAVVKNLPAFLLLHNSLVRSADPRLCCGVLGTLRSLWEWDQANFFLLEWTTQCLAQLAGCVWRKASSVHKLFFSLLEMVVFQLNYIPHETLRAVQSVLKQGLAGTLAGGGAGAEFGVTALSCYHRMTVRSGLVAEVLSDGGLLELLLGELRRRAKILRKAGVVPATRTGPQQEQSCVEASERAFTTCMLKVVAALTLRSIRNTVSVRDLGMVPYIKIFLDSEQYRGPALHILEQLAEINPEEFMSTAIGALCSSTPQEVALKHDLLQSVLKVLESPNSWDAFRRAGGFTGLLSLVVDMEGALSPRPPPQWGGGGGGTQWVLDLLLLALHILALAVHLHPVNAHQFQTGGFYERLAEALFQLGCFQMPPKDPQPLTGEEATPKKTPVGGDRDRPSSQGGRSFHQFVELAESTASVAPLSSSSSSPLGPSCTGPQPPPPPPPPLPPLPLSLRICVRLLSYLDQFATGTYATAAPELSFSGGGPGGSEEEEEEEERGDREREKPSGAAAVAGREREEGGGANAGSSSVGRRADSTSDPQSVEDVQERSRNAAFSVSSVFSESRFTCDHTILHPGAVRVIMTLLPAVFTPDDPQLSIEVQFSVANHIQALVKSERNRQIMCGEEEGGGLVPTLLTHCKAMLLAPDHPLHLPVTRILEKLSSQAITQSELRRFLCLADPLMCSADKVDAGQEEDPSLRTTTPISNGTEADGSIEAGEGETTGGRGSSTVEKTLKRSFSLLRSPASSSSSSSSSSFSSLPLHQIISLVSMTAPRNFRPHRLSSSPAFVEFDMSESGYGCLVLPSLATVKGVNADSIPTGGVGGECRGFPPAAGLSYSCWFHINRFSSACDSHPIRLLSVVRHMSRAEHHYVCLSVSFSACDGCLVISTEEEPYTFLDMMEPEVSSSPSPLPASLRFRCSSMLVPGQWHHLAVVLAKDVKKSCRVSAYLNGRTVGTAKMRYIQPFPGQYVSMDPTAVIDVYALIGTPSLWKEHAALLWRVGPAYLLEESLSAEAVAAIYAQGTAYLGNFLSLRHTGHEADMVDPPLPARLVPEERISFGINPSVATVTTATQIREDYNEVDCRLIAKEMGITSRDNSTPVFLARNLSQHLSGTARTIGAALVGNYGVRTFTPKSAATGFLYLGGPAVTLSLVAMAPDDSSLYAAMKVLVSVLETSPTMQQEMNRIHGYKLLSFLLKMKSVLVSSRTFQLVLYMCSSLELLSGPQCLPNTPAFQALLCNMEVWQNTADNLDLSVLNHFSDMLKTSSGDSGTAEAMHSVGLLSKLLYQLCDPSVSMRKVHLTACIITHLLKGHFTTLDISRIGLFLVYTLPPAGGSESESCGVSDRVHAEDSTVQTSGPASPVWTRNQLLLSLCDLLTSDDPLTTEQQKALFQTLGRDWFLLFLQAHLHPSTLRLALVLLTHLLARQSQQDGFREGLLPGTLVDGMDEPFVIMDNLRDDSWSYECLSSTCPGFHVLLELLVSQCHLPQVYGALAALLLGTTASTSAEGNLDSVLQSVIDNQADGTAHRLCPEAAAILLELVRIIISRPIPSGKRFSVSDDASWELQFPGSVMQFLCLLHSLRPRDPLWASAEFLHTLAGVVYPLDPLLDPLDPLDASQDGVEAGLTGEEEEEVASTNHPARKQVCDLTSHPARKQVCDFMRILLMDSLLNVPANNNSSHPLVQLLEFSPGEASLEQQQSFQTELLEFLMDIIHMISLENNQNNTHLNPQDCEGQMVILMENVALFSKTLVQRLYSGMLLADPDGLLTFLTDQIVVALEKGQSLKEKTISTLYSCTNKVLLYFLSHPRRSPAEQEVVTRTLRVVVARWDVVMATYNANVVFVTCLLHCLLMIRSGSYSEGFGCEVQKVHTQKILSCLFPLKTPRSASVSHTTHSTTAESELTSLAEACWSKVLTERRHTLENHHKIEISANQTGGAGPVGMTDVSPLWEEMSQKAWQIYIESQRSKASGGAVKMAGVISSALRSVQRRLGRESATVKDFLSCMESQRQRGHDMFENMRRNNMQLCSSEWERVSAQWLRVEADLLRERAVFGPGPGVEAPTTRDWVQDAAEGPNRTRPRIRRRALRWSKQVSGSLCLCLRTGASEQNNRSGTEPEAEPRILCEPGAEVNEADETSDCECLTFFPVLSETPASSSTEETPAEHPTSPESCSRRPSCPDLHVILQELQPGEEVVCKMCVVVVSGLRVTEGLVLFGKESLYVCEGFTVNSAGDVCCRKHHPSSVRESSISVSIMLSKEALSASCKRWPYEDIKETRFIRFLLEDNALEIFARNGHSAFLVFLNKDHVSAYKRLCSVVPSLKGRGVAEVIANARKTPVVGKTALNKWQRGEMSNFEYLMHLNTLAGRTYNDLMQYPVFPWVLADYSSENLDLSHASTFRDLSKPMGAQTEKRRAMFLQRYEEVENSAAEEGELSARCHYCTHYSSAIIVASFLVRMEPFSNTFLALQGGLDVPERMFHSVKKEWESASRDNMGDVRELIPEFYYLPDFLLNSNHIPLGSMQDGTTLGDVVLPPWAKGDPQEFIRVHREALESEHVSAHLHQWIDLIFGHRQQGATAVESINTFHPYFYAQKHRGVHDGPTDPLIRSTILGYVSNFGQVPKQLFTKPHPPRSGSKKDGSSPPHHVPFFFRLDKVKPNGQLFKELPKGPVGQILGLEKEMLVLERNRLLLSPLHSCYFGWGFPDNSCAFGNYTTEKTFAVCESPCDWGQTLCAACPDPATVVTGAASGVVCVWDVALSKDKLCHMRLRRPLYGHTEAVTCLAVSDVHSVIVSGSADLTCILWDLDELTYVTQLAGHMTSVTALAINQLSGEIASCAGPLLYLWTMKGQLLSWMDTSCGPQGDILCVAFTQKHEWDARNVIVTGCQDGIIRIWRTEYTRTQLPGPPEEPASPGREHPAQTERRVGGAGCWERHLVLCRELNRSQSTSGRRFKMKPAITALAMSRSHATLLAGDAWGRVYIWTCE